MAIATAELPIVAAETDHDIVDLCTTVPTNGPETRPPVADSTRRSGALGSLAVHRSGTTRSAAPRTSSHSADQYQRVAGDEPIPGYVLMHPLGRGGFGEVWKCEAPGGLMKAIKFVKATTDSNHELRQEYEAFEQVKAIRHPFLLCLERVELVENVLVMVMGLADRHIGERYLECQASGLSGIPREELIAYLREAAEALDVISAQHGLQHLDVKPANLFLTAGHLQVGDYGLVSKLDGGSGSGKNRGLTPKYASPEVLRGLVHTQSDQYSLALVYYEMLTGSFPYAGRSAQQMMLLHISGEPDLAALPLADRAAVGRAVAKSPDDRFPSCLEFIDALGPTDSRLTRRSAAIPFPTRPPLAATKSNFQAQPNRTPAEAPCKIKLREVRSVVSCEALQGSEVPSPSRSAEQFVGAVLEAAGDRSGAASGDSSRLPDGTWACRFLTTVSPRLAKVKLDLVWEEGGWSMDTREENRIVFRKTAPVYRLFGKKEFAGLEVVIDLPDNGGIVGELTAVGRMVGTPKADFTRNADEVVSELFAAVRQVLNNVQERRKHERLRAEFAVLLTALRSDGSLEMPVVGRCMDVSAGGLAIQLTQPLASKYAYVAFDGIPAIRGVAILFQTIKAHSIESGFVVTGRYRTDL